MAVAAGTLPPADDRLFGPDTFGAGWLVAGTAALVAALGGLVWVFWPRRRPRLARELQHVVGLRDHYLLHLDDLEQQVIADRLTPRALHHELSRTMRRFAVELGTNRANSMSASALDAAGQRHIAAAVRRYEHPQFEEQPAGDPLAALGIARAVVASAPEPRTHDPIEAT